MRIAVWTHSWGGQASEIGSTCGDTVERLNIQLHCGAQASHSSALEPGGPPSASASAPRAAGGSLRRCRDGTSDSAAAPSARPRRPRRFGTPAASEGGGLGDVCRRLARALEAVVGRPVARPLRLGVPSCPEPPCAPSKGASTEPWPRQGRGGGGGLTLPADVGHELHVDPAWAREHVGELAGELGVAVQAVAPSHLVV